MNVEQAMRSTEGQKAIQGGYALSFSAHVEETGRLPTEGEVAQMRRSAGTVARLVRELEEQPDKYALAPQLAQWGRRMLERQKRLCERYGA